MDTLNHILQLFLCFHIVLTMLFLHMLLRFFESGVNGITPDATLLEAREFIVVAVDMSSVATDIVADLTGRWVRCTNYTTTNGATVLGARENGSGTGGVENRIPDGP